MDTDERQVAADTGRAGTLQLLTEASDMPSLALPFGKGRGFFNLGLHLYQTGRVAKAVDVWEQAVRLDPGNDLVVFCWACSLAEQGDRSSAQAALEALLHRCADFHEARLCHVILLRDLARLSEALAEAAILQQASPQLLGAPVPGPQGLQEQVLALRWPKRLPARMAAL